MLNLDDFIGYIDGSIRTPPELEEDESRKFKDKYLLACSHCVLNLVKEAETNLTSILSDDASAKMVWAQFKYVYQKYHLKAILNLQSTLHKVHYNYGKDIENHSQSFEAAFVTLAPFITPVSNIEKFFHILRSLPESLSHITTVAGRLELSYDQYGHR